MKTFRNLFGSIKDFVDTRKEVVSSDMDNSLGSYLQEVSLLTDADREDDDTQRVKMMTIHAAKGLEFPCVYVVGLEEKLFPSEMALRSLNELEEERRLFYVAVTRAEKRLTLSYAAVRNRFGSVQSSDPSRFLNDISPFYLDIRGGKPSMVRPPNYAAPEGNSIKQNIQQSKQQQQQKQTATPAVNLPTNIRFVPTPTYQLKEGQNVLHQRFGSGKILMIDGKSDNLIATIAFDVMGEKRIMLKFAQLMVVE